MRDAAARLEQQGANRYRVAAYRKAAETVESLHEDIGLINAWYAAAKMNASTITRRCGRALPAPHRRLMQRPSACR